MTFLSSTEHQITDNRAGWRNPKHARQWHNTLETYVFPVTSRVPVSEVDTGMIRKILRPIWATKSETASGLLGRIEAVQDYARTHAWRTDENPGRWKGHLENVLHARSKVAKLEHRAALP